MNPPVRKAVRVREALEQVVQVAVQEQAERLELEQPAPVPQAQQLALQASRV